MPDTFASGFPLYEQLSQNSENDPASLLTRFKGHVKKELVDVPSIPNYFAGLLYILDEPKLSDSQQLVTLAHSSLCYLVKRVAMQSPAYFGGSVTIHNLVVHLFLLGGNSGIQLEGRSFWVSSIRALEAMYLIQPVALQQCIEKLLKEEEMQRRKVLLIMQEMLQISEKVEGEQSREAFFQKIIPSLIDVLNHQQDDENAVASLICDIVVKNETDKNQLQNFARLIENPDNKSLFENIAAIAADDEMRFFRSSSSLSHHQPQLDVGSELRSIFDEFQIFSHHYSDSNVVDARELGRDSMEYIQTTLETLLVPFQNLKETEQNWKSRQANLVEMRSLVQNQFVLEHQIEFLSCCKELQLMECVGRAVLSLRTTLSTTACLVVKDFLQNFAINLDSVLLDQMFESLRTLLFSSKKISSTNAFNCLVIMLSNIDFHNKLFQNCFMLINQKSTLPKNCSAVLLRIFIIKFHNTSKLENSVIYIEEWLKKGITDAQTSVREAMRKTFWYYYKCYPNQAKKFLHSQLSSQLRKAVELSIPQNLHVDYQPTVPNSSVSSVASSRRTSFGVKNFPSYAKPTQSSNAFLQRVANARSTSEYVLRENNVNTNMNNPSKRKISAPPQLAKRSLTTPAQPDSHHHDNHSSVSTRSPTKVAQGSRGDDSHKMSSSEYRNETADNLLQIDLTDDVSHNHSNSLIKKYMGYKVGDGNVNLETMYQYLESSSLAKLKDGLQMLQNSLLMESERNNSDTTLDFERLTPLIKNIMVKIPQELKPLVSIPKFCRSIPLKYLIEIYTINCLSFSAEFLSSFSLDKILWTIFEIFDYLDSSINQQENESSPALSLHYMKYKQFIFNFCFKLLQKVLKTEFDDSSEITEALGQCINKLAQICGQEYDEDLYYDTFYQIYLCKMPVLVEKLRQVTYVSTKLKICRELEARDKSGNFNRDMIVSRQSLDGSEHGDFAEEHKEELIDERKFMEMTMVNPFKQMRATSGGSVVHHEPNASEVVAHASGTNGEIEEDHYDLNQKKLSEITKVVSVYQPVDSTTIEDREINDKVNESENNDVDMSGIQQERSVYLSDIFGTSQEHETTVKFSKEPPQIINSTNRSSSSAGMTNMVKDENNNLTRNVSMERDKSPMTPLTDHQSKELSKGINSIDIGKKHEFTNLHEVKGGSNLSAEILANAIKENDNIEHISGYELLEVVPSDSLVYYEISHAVAVTNDYDSPEQLLMQMKKSITRIQSRSFTMKHLNCLIAPLIICLHEESLRSWLEVENGYDELLQLSETLFHSTDETQMLPVNLACKSIVLIECLVLSNGYLQNVTPIVSPIFKKIWEDIIVMVGKLPEYSSEIYCLLQELRDLLGFLKFFTAGDITRILHGLTSEVNDETNGIKETFLMETLSVVLSNPRIAFQKRQIMEIIEVMQFYLGTNKTEWRCVSCEVLSRALKHLDLNLLGNSGSIEVLNGLTDGRRQVVRNLLSR